MSLREHTSTATSGAFAAICVAAVLSAIGWALYLPGHISADLFVAVLRFTLGIGVGAVVFVPVYVVTAMLRDRLCGKGERR